MSYLSSTAPARCTWRHGQPHRRLDCTARNLALSLGERLQDLKVVLRDRGSNFTRSFDAFFQANGTKILRTAVRAPHRNAIYERLADTLHRELLDRMLIPWRAPMADRSARPVSRAIASSSDTSPP
jgi:hypothetical protein